MVRAVEGAHWCSATSRRRWRSGSRSSATPSVIEEALKDALGWTGILRCALGVGDPVPDIAATACGRRRVDPAQRAEEDSMLAEAGSDDAQAPRRDPEEAALELLQNELGARRIDGS